RCRTNTAPVRPGATPATRPVHWAMRWPAARHGSSDDGSWPRNLELHPRIEGLAWLEGAQAVRRRIGHVDGVVDMTHRFGAEDIALRPRIDDEIGQRGRELKRQAFVADAHRPAPALEAVVEVQMRHVR